MMLPSWWNSDKPYVIGDCMDIMKGMPDNSVDITFTSPPFKEEDVDGDYWIEYDKWFKEMERITSKVLIIIHSSTKSNELIAKHPPKRLMIWGKGVSKYSYRFNIILLYQMSVDYKINKYVWCDCFGIESIQGNAKIHKYQDPLILYQTILKMFKGCEIVFDPFLGSGTTLHACQRTQKIGLGCEIEPCFEEMIKRSSCQDITKLDRFGGDADE